MSEYRRRRNGQGTNESGPAGRFSMTQGEPETANAAGQFPLAQGTPAMEQRAVRTGEEEAAYNLGARMGAAGMAAQANPAANGPAGTNPAAAVKTRMTEDRIIEAERLLMQYKQGKASVDRRIINAQD